MTRRVSRSRDAVAERCAGHNSGRGLTTVAVVWGPAFNVYGFFLYLPLAPIALVAALIATIRGPASG